MRDIGFTMFVVTTHLAFDYDAIISLAKLFIVTCSLLMGILGLDYHQCVSYKSKKLTNWCTFDIISMAMERCPSG